MFRKKRNTAQDKIVTDIRCWLSNLRPTDECIGKGIELSLTLLILTHELHKMKAEQHHTDS